MHQCCYLAMKRSDQAIQQISKHFQIYQHPYLFAATGKAFWCDKPNKWFPVKWQKKTSTSASKCGSCKKMVKDDYTSDIACDYCGVWYHGCSCAGLSQDDVTVMGRISGCLCICSVCHNDDVFTSEAKLNFWLLQKNIKFRWNQFKILLMKLKQTLNLPIKFQKLPLAENSLVVRF